MGKVIVYRLMQLPLILLAVSAIVFFALRLAPGDPVAAAVASVADPDVELQIRHEWGLDLPLTEQYLVFLGKSVHGDFGISFFGQVPVVDTLKARFPATVELALAGTLIGAVLGLGFGILAAVRANTRLDALIRSFTLVGMSIPAFWLGLMFIALLAVILGWLPAGGRFASHVKLQPITGFLVLDFLMAGDFHGLGTVLTYLAMPALTLGLGLAGFVARITRLAVIESLRQDYVRTAYSKGLNERTVVVRHALRNALLPIVTVLGLQFGNLLGGAAVTETVFAWPGLGKLLVDSLYVRDYPQVQASVLLLAVTYVLTNMFVDILYHVIDPRIRR